MDRTMLSISSMRSRLEKGVVIGGKKGISSLREGRDKNGEGTVDLEKKNKKWWTMICY